MQRVRFYLQLTWRNLRRDGRWTSLAILGVAAGVAAMVALRSLGLAVNDALLLNLREVNRGDINVRSVPSGPFAFAINQGAWERNVFEAGDLQRIEAAVAGHDGSLTAYSVWHNVQFSRHDGADARRPGIISSFFIDPASFAISHHVAAEEPPGAALDRLLGGGAELVVSRRLAASLSLQPGDLVSVSGSGQPYRVTGIVPDHSEANLRDLASSFFGFAYFHRDQALQLQLNPAPNQISIRLPQGSAPETVRQLGLDLWALDAGIHSMTTTPDLLLRNVALAELIERFVVLTGLAALLIGAAGIVNTMLVLTRRRLLEIAALKTLGLGRRQITVIFGLEALMLGMAGSLAGVPAGVVLGRFVSGFGETLIQRPVSWQPYPQAMLFGLAMGLVVTLVFGLLPVSIAARVRPASILRPAQARLPRASLREMALALPALLLVTGAIAGEIIRPLLQRALPGVAVDATVSGVLLVALLLVLLGSLAAALLLSVWLVSRLPAGDRVEMRLVLANLGMQRVRNAFTPLALGVGVFALSIVSFLGLGARQVLHFRFTEALGGNLLVVPLVQRDTGRLLFNLLPGLRQDLRSSTQYDVWTAQLIAIDGVAVNDDVGLPLIARELHHPDLRSGDLVAGRDLTADDAGQSLLVLARGSPVEMLLRESALERQDIGPGTLLGLRVDGREMLLEVAGIVSSSSNAILPGVSLAFLPPGLLDPRDSLARFHVLDVAPGLLDDVLSRLGALPLLLAVDVNLLDGLIVNLLGQLGALPLAVGLLSLAAAGVMMGNTVMLATLERQRQTGVLRALGLRRRQVLRVLLLENTVLGLLGALPGIALGVAGQSLVTALGTGTALPPPAEAHSLIAALLLATLLLAWLATLAGARSAMQRPVAQVLRYE